MKLQVRLSGRAEQLLNRMTETLEASVKDVILDSLALYYRAMRELSQGRQFGSYDPQTGQFTAFMTPTLSALEEKLATEVQEQQKIPA